MQCQETDVEEALQIEMSKLMSDYSAVLVAACGYGIGSITDNDESMLRHADDGKHSDVKIETDMHQKLKRVTIPVFSGDKCKYESWKAAFNACVNQSSATDEYKLLQLRQYLAGEALSAIVNLGRSAAGYKAAKERLERKYGGTAGRS